MTYPSRLHWLLGLLAISILAWGYYYLHTHPLLGYSKSRVQVYLLAGQSNMAGRGFIATADTEQQQGIYQIDVAGRVVPARHPTHFDKPLAGFGMGIPFANAVRKGCGDCVILLVPAAMGSSSILDWRWGGTAFERAVAMARKALAHGELRAILWHQGESEARALGEDLVPAYIAALTQAVADLRVALGAANVPWIAGTLADTLAQSGHHPSHRAVNRAIAATAKTVPGFFVVDTSHLDDVGDKIHFSTPALREMGRRYAERFAQVKEMLARPANGVTIAEPGGR